MSLLNQENDGMVNVLIILYEYILKYGPQTDDKLKSICDPEVVRRTRKDSERVGPTINTWVKLGFFERDAEGRVGFASQLPKAIRNKETGREHLPRVLRELVMDERNNTEFWEAKDSRAADFSRGLAWCLAVDPFVLHNSSTGYSAVADLQRETLPSGTLAIQNSTRWGGLQAWVSYLGFGWFARYPKKGTLTIDPSEAIAEALPRVFDGESQLSERRFRERLASILPVLDGGKYRQEVESKLRPGTWTKPKQNELSLSLSLALLRLETEGQLTFADRADSLEGKVKLMARNDRSLRSCTHILYRGDAR